MNKLKLHNNIDIFVEVDGSLFKEYGLLKLEFFHLGRYRKKVETIVFIQDNNLTEDSNSTTFIRRFRGVWESSSQTSEFAMSPWSLRVSILDEDGNSYHTVEFKDLFTFEFPFDGLELSTLLNVAVLSEPVPEIPENVPATAIKFNPEGLGIQATTVQEAIHELANKTVYVGD